MCSIHELAIENSMDHFEWQFGRVKIDWVRLNGIILNIVQFMIKPMIENGLRARVGPF